MTGNLGANCLPHTAAHYSLIARKFFAAGYALDGHGSKHAHEGKASPFHDSLRNQLPFQELRHIQNLTTS
jgi:hypothetical protein